MVSLVTVAEARTLEEIKKKLPPAALSCYQNALGERFGDIMQNKTKMTSPERVRMTSCYKVLRKISMTKMRARLSPERKACLQRVLGNKAYEVIMEGERPYSQQERQKIKECYKPSPAMQARQAKYRAYTACVKREIGEDALAAIQKRERKITPEERAKLLSCQEEAGLRPVTKKKTPTKPKPKISADLKACLINVVGERGYLAILNKQRQPTAEEKSKAGVCFKRPGPKEVKKALEEETPETPEEPTETPDKPTPPAETPKPAGYGKSWQSCMKERIGEQALQAIIGGEREATPAELDSARFCGEQ